MVLSDRSISANVDLDDYFELMIRNAWHISGGEGWCENTTNRRVLVTHEDGSQAILVQSHTSLSYACDTDGGGNKE